ncbi:HDIG domain-containing protein, partial [Patescibacteria group bacterium]|nr:HDIG domain-containing protein [Patescibacteria group bacterium]
MERDKALNLLKENLFNKNLIKHCLAVEAIMRGLAQKFGEDSEQWELAGLLHDIDYEKTKDVPEKHSLIGAEMLKEIGLGE